jgi:tRNA pseudouridine38-40 synthase
MSRTFLAVLHFDGTGFVGWQRQPAGRSVQVEFERVLERIFARRAVAHAAGRTDAGVHAVGLAISFSADASWSPVALRRALNALLPKDCWVESVHPMRPGFHARKSALSRRYRYDIGTDAAAASPFRRRFEWALARRLDAGALRAAAKLLAGEHDFRAFAVKGEPKPHYLCRLSRAEWVTRPEGRGVSFHVEADRFLHHMVRMLVGTMVDVGLDRRPLADIEALLERGDNSETSPPAPPQGLYFVAATYPEALYTDQAEEAHAGAERA